jgi:uncharacterized protein YbjT (DUF2867 family)
VSEQRATNVVVAGATGLVGREVLAFGGRQSGVRLLALVRKAPAGLPPEVLEVPFDYESAGSYANLGDGVPCDILICALGTTRAKAGSDEAFRRVDRDYPLRLIERLAQLTPRPLFALVSSVGAGGAGLYLQTKAEVEEALVKSGLPHVIVRPSLLLGERGEQRTGEQVATAVGVPFGKLVRAVGVKSLERYAPIEAADVARALLKSSLASPRPTRLVLEGRALFDAAR